MPLREDILRGVRVGSILLAVLLVGFAGYRVMREPAGTVPTRAPEPRSAAPAPTPHVVPSTSGPAIPPPPPPKNRKARSQPPVQSALAETTPSEPVAPVEQPVADVYKSDSPVAETEEKAAPVVAEQKSEPPPAVDDGTDSQDGRGRRWLKAVGRFLHVGKKDATSQQSIRQP